jgi:hypothetical protein
LAIKPAWLELTGHVDVLFRRLAARKLQTEKRLARRRFAARAIEGQDR